MEKLEETIKVLEKAIEDLNKLKESEFKRGDIVLVWNDEEPELKYIRVYYGFLNGEHYAYDCDKERHGWDYCEKLEID